MMNENRLPVVQERDLIHFDSKKVNLIKRTVAKNASNDQLDLFLHQCQKTGLDPLARQIYCVMRWNKKDKKYDMSIQTAIDGYRLIADRTDKYAGSDDYTFDHELSQYGHMNLRKNRQDYPTTATVTVYKLIGGIRVPFTATAAWESYYPGDGPPGFMWRKFQYLMIGKCAEGLALRKAFPAELSGVYIREEMEQDGFVDIVDVKAESFEDAIAGPHVVQGADPGDMWVEDDEPVSEEPPEPVKAEPSDNGQTNGKPEPKFNGRIADARAWLEAIGPTTLGIIADAVLMTGLYDDREHVRNTLEKDEPDMVELQEAGLGTDFRRKVTNTLLVFDLLMARKETTADA